MKDGGTNYFSGTSGIFTKMEAIVGKHLNKVKSQLDDKLTNGNIEKMVDRQNNEEIKAVKSKLGDFGQEMSSKTHILWGDSGDRKQIICC